MSNFFERPLNRNLKPKKVFLGLFSVLVLFLPFHAFLTVWINTFTGHYRLIQLWKELLVVALLLLLFVIAAKTSRQRLISSLNDRLVLVVTTYAAWSILHGTVALILEKVGLSALLFGLVLNLRYLILFLVVLLFFQLHQKINFPWARLLLYPATLVVFFGIAQAFFLPHDVLANFGYSSSTILPFQYVDNDPNLLRVQSTLRGANPLGAYLILVITAGTTLFICDKKYRWNPFLGTACILTLLVLFYTYSRSAWLGSIVSIVLGVWWCFKHPKTSRNFKIVAATFLFLIVGVGSYVATSLESNEFVQNAIFHTDEDDSTYQSSNSVRAAYIKQGVKDIADDPEGRGIGTAGPASVWNFRAPARIAENYYLQIAQETGILGLGMFVLINLMVAYRLWLRRRYTIASVMLASLMGISLVALLQHAWADDTLALLWWGFAGLALSKNID